MYTNFIHIYFVLHTICKYGLFRTSDIAIGYVGTLCHFYLLDQDILESPFWCRRYGANISAPIRAGTSRSRYFLASTISALAVSESIFSLCYAIVCGKSNLKKVSFYLPCSIADSWMKKTTYMAYITYKVFK